MTKATIHPFEKPQNLDTEHEADLHKKFMDDILIKENAPLFRRVAEHVYKARIPLIINPSLLDSKENMPIVVLTMTDFVDMIDGMMMNVIDEIQERQNDE